MRQRGKNGQYTGKCDEDVQNTQDKNSGGMRSWRCEEVLPRLKEGDLETASRMFKASRM